MMQDEVVSISEKVVIKVSDLVTWLDDDDDVKWQRGSPSVWEKHCAAPSTADAADAADAPDVPDAAGLDMRDVIRAKEALLGKPRARLVNNMLQFIICYLSYIYYAIFIMLIMFCVFTLKNI